jgi:hypothetical protein
MMSGSGDVFKTAWAWVREDKTSLAWKISTTGPDLSNLEELFGEKKREQFKHLLHRTPLHEDLEPWSTEVQLAYERTLSYIGSIQIAIDGGEKRWQTFRRVVVFPTRGCVSDVRPEALYRTSGGGTAKGAGSISSLLLIFG